ncbi:HsdM family class I SAM-dependent methyltransferase [Winogradskyella aquimaris]|uniref:N-6 DNA methylase n=1 Tax=Winogradskyella aquimaris TaxID=864074 RepID=A0ABU5EUT1_9FLAO|nr:N-6 DNA methylase [Winogradskyella aquimaris]MDY2588482.1 N-6 DNA methylase [Winogradskyella aquimaris]
MAKVTYNERSWAIDVISSIEVFLANKSWHFKGAGGESTISNNKKSLFPDVLLFKDLTKDIIVQGWELKMPDTQINDAELIRNAIKKAKILKRDSFLLWNVKSAVLYIRNGDNFEIHKSWNDININSRSEVKPNEQLWKELLYEILADLNNFFESGEIPEVTSQEILSIDEVIDVVLENTNNTAETLKAKARTTRQLDAEINLWWNSSSNEYGFTSTQTEHKLATLSMVVLTDWVFKIIFAHILKRHFNEAKEIENIERSTSIVDAMEILTSISQKCNFWNIFSPNLGQQYISETAWSELTELNQFLSTVNIEAIEIEILHQLLQNTIATAKRKVAGQFSTPKKLADLLTRLTIDDKTKIVIDPCCGTGTIIKQAYELKEEYEINSNEILNTIWASDKHSFPIQLSTLSMAKPSNIGRIINVFNSDVIELNQGDTIEFRNPNNGEIVEKEFPTVDYVVSNLPFIKSKEMKVLNPHIVDINDRIKEEADTTETLSGKSDIFAYIPFYLHQFLSENGKIGLILSNAWLGTDYGEIFLELFQKFFKIELVVISGKGKWFDNADVVTTILVASKKDPQTPTSNDSEISFCTLNEKLEEIDDIRTLSDNIIVNVQSENLTINRYSIAQINSFEDFGIPWSGYFSNLSWVANVRDRFINTSDFFHFTRGERRGWNPMFYPASGHNIEQEYIKPVLKHLRDTTNLECVANAEAFCCSRSIEELENSGHNGAIAWIRSFENQRNGTNRPLPEVLAKPNMHWYEMSTENMADFVANVNYDKSLFIAKFENRSFIDQRMIGFSIRDEYQEENKTLFLALLNSTASLFLIESFGFGRGLGALDLRATKFERDFKILNPNILSQEQKNQIVELFSPIMQRNRLPLEQELESEDRIVFENALMEIYGISEYYEPIKNSLKQLYQIRFAVKD